MSLSKEQVERVAMLARLEISEDEVESYRQQLNEILEHIDKLNKLDTDNIEPTAHILPMQNVFREDKVKDGLPKEQVLGNAPVVVDGQFKVPKIV